MMQETQAATFAIEELDGSGARAAAPELAGILMDCEDGGASVSFLAPLTRERAEAFWIRVADAVERGDTILLVARDRDAIRGTVQAIVSLPENQPHRADIAKLLVHRGARRQGMAEALMRGIEARTVAVGKSLLVLDTASADAERVYRRLGWSFCGVVPDYALNPDGTFCDTTFFWKRIAAHRLT